jgi:hypothetical protein
VGSAWEGCEEEDFLPIAVLVSALLSLVSADYLEQ